MGYAIDFTSVTDIITNLMNKETRHRCRKHGKDISVLKERMLHSQSSEQFRMPEGVYVSRVMKGGGAVEAGITKGMCHYRNRRIGSEYIWKAYRSSSVTTGSVRK